MTLIYHLVKYYLLFISIFFIGRVGLFILYFDRVKDDTSLFVKSFLLGLQLDTIVASIFLLIPLILLSFSPKLIKSFVDKFLRWYFLIIASFLIYIEIATFPFFAQYDVRPNYLFVEYLVYPKEVFNMILADYKLALLLAFSIIGVFGYTYLKKFKNTFLSVFEINNFKRILLFIPLLVVLFIGIRSSFGHRPANISDAMFSDNRILNEVTKNSLYSIGYAIYSNAKHGTKDIAKRYGKMDINEAKQRVQNRLGIENADDKYFLTRFEKSHFKKQKNIVIFIQESLGYQFTTQNNGTITPNLNRYKNEAINFTHLYSNGTRSVRGIAGLVAGNYSIPGKGVVKRNKSQKDYFTIAQILKPLGYHSTFMYGGESRFDNMKGWFLGNGFDEVIDQEKYSEAKYIGTWGVSDGDVVKRALKEFTKHYNNNQKFATVIFSTSNHTPFDFPDNTIELVDGVAKKSVENAVKYADYAIGELLKNVKNEPYYKDTIFVIASDHNVRVYGDDIVPVNMFHIPGFIMGGEVEAKEYSNQASQGDLLATALDLAGISGRYPIMGNSIFSDMKKDINLMQFNDRYALRVGDKVSVIVPNKEAQTFKYVNKHLEKSKHDRELEKDLLAFITVLNHIYNERLYK